MGDLLRLFVNNLLPIFLAAGTGYLLAHFLHVPARPLSQAAFYIFSPCLIFYSLVTTPLKGNEIGRILLFTLLVIAASGLLTLGLGRAFHFKRQTLAASLLASMFNNSGNYGLAVVLFTFGDSALAYASLYFVFNSLLTSSAGSLIASLGNESLGKSLKNMLKVPAVYGLLLGLILLAFGWKLPLPVDRAVNMLSQASIPVLMVVLGIQLHGVKIAGNRLPLGVISFVRLVAAPAFAFLVAGAIGMDGAARQASLAQAAMPTAILSTVIATEYNLQPSFVSAAVLITTLLSPLTLTPLLALLGG